MLLIHTACKIQKNQDYDVDFCVKENETEKLLSLRNKFEELGFVTYVRNEFIWHKLGGDLFQIGDPILRMYIPTFTVIFSSHVEFFAFHDETGQTAKEKGIYRLPYNVRDDMILSCSDDPTCWQKDKIFPLKKSKENIFGIEFYYPNDPEYVFTVDYGEDWRTPHMKGWKSIVCYDKWEDGTIAVFKCVIILWYLGLAFVYVYYKQYKKGAVQKHMRGSELQFLVDEGKTV